MGAANSAPIRSGIESFTGREGRQLGDIRRNPPRLILAEQLGGAKLLGLSGRVNRWQIQFRGLSSVYRQEFGPL
jgi:hypothetical protein